MGKEPTIQVEGTVIEPLPNTEFKVELEDGRVINAYLGGKMRMHYIKILPGDRVTIEMSPYNLETGRITYRHKGRKPKTQEPEIAASNPLMDAMSEPEAGVDNDKTDESTPDTNQE